MEPKVLLYHIEEEKFSKQEYETQIGYLQKLAAHFERAVMLQEEAISDLFMELNPQTVLCVTTSSELVSQLQGLGIAVVGFETDQESFMQASLVVLGLDEISYMDLCRAYQRWHKMPWHILETKRLKVRELAISDLPALQELYDAPGITDYIEPLYPPEQERVYEEDYIKNIYGFYGYGMWLLFDKATGQLVGRGGLEYRETCQEGQVEMGYIIHPDFQRKGLATEACKAFLQYAKEKLAMQEVICRVHPQNVASIRLMEHLGFKNTKEEQDIYYTYTL